MSLLAKYGYTEQMAYELCERCGLLSPIYKSSGRSRGGCWFCPNTKISEFCEFRRKHHDLWKRLEELEDVPNQASFGFKCNTKLSEIVEKMDAYDFMNNQPNLFDI